MSLIRRPSSPTESIRLVSDNSDYPTFQPLPGGDQVLQSSDGHNFRVHAMLLMLASSVFRKMLDSKNLGDRIIRLDEDKDALSMVLEYIYPGGSPVVNTLAHLKKGLAAAKAYELDSLTKDLDQQLRRCMKADPTSFEPFTVWDVANTFGLIETREIAAGLVTVARRDLRQPQILAELAREYPEVSALIRLVGAQGVRTKALADVLFAFHQPPMLLFTTTNTRSRGSPIRYSVLLMCTDCTTKVGTADYITPTWMVWWAHTAYDFLLSNPLETSDHLFEPSIMWNHPGCRSCCISALMCEPGHRSHFIAWASEVKAEIFWRLHEAESLHSP